ncbi:MAG: CHASE2 domain-containing protein [Fibrobacterota bacterium]
MDKIRQHALNYFCVYAVVTALTLLVLVRITEMSELKAYDCLCRFFSKPAVSREIVLVEIDNNTVDVLGNPLGTDKIAALIHILSGYGASVIGLDFYWPVNLEKDTLNCRFLGGVLAEAGNVACPIPFLINPDSAMARQTSPFPSLVEKSSLNDDGKYFLFPAASHYFGNSLCLYENAKAIGHTNLIVDKDGKFRRVPLFVSYQHKAYPALSLVAASLKLQSDPRLEKGSVFLYPLLRTPVNKKGEMILSYGTRYPTYSAINILQRYKAGLHQADSNAFRDKIVLIGNTVLGASDFGATPLSPYYPLFYVHADAISTLLSHRAIVQASFAWNAVWLLLLGFVMTLPFLGRGRIHPVFLSAMATLLYFLIAVTAFSVAGVWMDIVTPMFHSVLLLIALSTRRHLDIKNEMIAAMEKLQEELRIKERLAGIGEVSSMIAHEIRNPLSSIKLHAGLIERKAVDPSFQEHIQIIKAEGERLNRFITDFFNLAKPVSPALQSCNLNELVRAALGLMKPDFEAKNVLLQSQLYEGSPLLIHGDADRIKQALINILKNAMEAATDKGRVEIITGRSGEKVIFVEINDNGPGISDTARAKLFLPFYTTKALGSGFGLSIVKQIMDAHGATVELRNRESGGLSVRLAFAR